MVKIYGTERRGHKQGLRLVTDDYVAFPTLIQTFLTARFSSYQIVASQLQGYPLVSAR